MSTPNLKEIVEQPMTGLRFGLADKLLRVRSTTVGTNPFEEQYINKIIEVLEEHGVRTGQVEHLKGLRDRLNSTIKALKNPGEIIWEILLLFRMISSENSLDEAVKISLDRVMMDWQGYIFPKVEFDLFLKSLQYICEDGLLEDELHNAQESIREGLAPNEPDLKTPEKQLLWAAHLLYLLFNPELMQLWPRHRQGKGSLHTTQLWRQILSSKTVRYLRALYANHIFNLLRKDDLLVGWGAPGTWFSFSLNPPPGKINCDLLYSMLAGFEHSRACVVHEISHAVLTKGVPSYISELNDAMQDIDGQGHYALSQELQLKQYFLNACEDNCINRFTEQIGRVFGQDYGYSLNNFYTAIGDVGRRYLRKRDIYGDPTPENQFKNLTFIISRVFLANNGLFENTPEAWSELRAKPEWLEARDRDNPEEFLSPEASFEQLIGMCEEVEQYYPPLRELSGGPDYYAEQATIYAERRFELIHEMWELFAEDIARQILQDEATDASDAMDNFEVETNQTPPPPKKDKEEDKDEKENEDKDNNPTPPSEADQSADNESADDLDGEDPEEGREDEEGEEDKPEEASEEDSKEAGEEDESEEASEEEESEEAGTGGEGQAEDESDAQDDNSGEEGEAPPQPAGAGKSEGSSDSQDEKEEESGENEDSGEKEQKGEDENAPEEPTPHDHQDENDPNAKEQESEKSEGEEKKDGPSLEELINQLSEEMKDLEIKEQFNEDDDAEQKLEEDEENAEAELIREEIDDTLEPEYKEPPQSEQEGNEGDRGADHGGVDNNEIIEREWIPEEELASISDLMEALKEADEAEKEQEKQREKREEIREDRKYYEPPQLEIPKTMSLDELATGSWEDFSKRVTLHGAVIGVMAKGLEKLKKAQLKFIHKVSKKHSLIPEGGDLRRFDQEAMYKLLRKMVKREKFDKESLNMFRKDMRKVAETRPTRIILIDGSRSMSMGIHPLPMDKALQEAVIDYMASRIAGYDTYITMFGPRNPLIIAQPGNNLVEIGKRIELVQGGLNTMTYLSPALLETIRMVAYSKKSKEAYVGFTNFVIYSDGDIDDMATSRAIIQQIFQHAPKTTFDFVLITTKQATPMDVLINTLDVTNPLHEIGIVRGNSSRRYPMALTATYKLTNRLQNSPSGIADPSFLRSGQFKRLFQLLTQNSDY